MAMGKIRKDKDRKLVKSREKYAKYVIKSNFKEWYPFLK